MSREVPLCVRMQILAGIVQHRLDWQSLRAVGASQSEMLGPHLLLRTLYTEFIKNAHVVSGSKIAQLKYGFGIK